MNDQQISAIKCAFADLCGSLQAFNQMDIFVHDWDSHRESIQDLSDSFGDFLDPIPDGLCD